MSKTRPVALVISDLHLSLKQPSCRADKDWMEVQANHLQQVKDLAKGLSDKIPILCAGDVFDRWNPPPELIHFALKHLPDGMICVPGQHDLPNHRIEEMDRSGYGVLDEAGKILDISHGGPLVHGKMDVYGYGWGQEILSPGQHRFEEASFMPRKGQIAVALIHRYCWYKEASYPGAPEESNLLNLSKELEGYHAAFFGDNHIGFMKKLKSGLTVVNCGGFIRRKSDEIPLVPKVSILHDDGSVEQRPLDTSFEKFHDRPEEREELPVNMKEFIESLEGLGEHGLDFRRAVLNHLESEKINPKTKEIILEALQD